VLAGKKGISQMSKPGFAFSPLDSFAPETAMIGFNWQRPADEITLNEDSPLPAQMMQLAATISFWLKKEGFQLEMTGLGKEAEKMGWRLKEFIKMIPASSENDTSLFAKVIQLAKGAKVVIRQGRCLIESTDSQELQKVIHQLLQQQFTEQEVVITEEIRNNRSLLCQGNQELIRIASAVRQREDSNLKPIKDVVELIKDGLLKYLPECPDGGQYSVEVVDSILQVKCSFHQGDLK
jgi:flagellar biosynthesis regulator FlaF